MIGMNMYDFIQWFNSFYRVWGPGLKPYSISKDCSTSVIVALTFLLFKYVWKTGPCRKTFLKKKKNVFLKKKKIEIGKSREFLQCSRNAELPGVNKLNDHLAGISSHWRAKKGIKTAKVWPQKANKATLEGKVGKRESLSSILLKARSYWPRFWANISQIISLKLTCHFPFSTFQFCEFCLFSISWRNGRGFSIDS